MYIGGQQVPIIVGGKTFFQRAFVQTKYYKCKIRNKNGDYINFCGKNLLFTFTKMLNEKKNKEKN